MIAKLKASIFLGGALLISNYQVMAVSNDNVKEQSCITNQACNGLFSLEVQTGQPISSAGEFNVLITNKAKTLPCLLPLLLK